jgi:hypothetical protein
MDQLVLWLPWAGVAAVVALLLYRRPAPIRPVAIIVEAAMVVVAYALYYVVRGSTEGSVASAVDAAERMIDVERWFRIYWEPEMQEFVLDHHWLTLFFNWVYIWWHWPVIIVVAVWLFLYRPVSYRLYRDAFVLSGAVGLIFFAAIPVAPPRLSDPGIVDTISLHSPVYRDYESPAFVNQYAAFPSLHFCWNLLAALAVLRLAPHPLLRAGAILSPVLVLISIIVTGNHFIIDALAGAVLALLALAAARWLIVIPLPVAPRVRRVRSPD